MQYVVSQAGSLMLILRRKSIDQVQPLIVSFP